MTSKLWQIRLPQSAEQPRTRMEALFDDTSLATCLGIRTKTLWWLIRGNVVTTGPGDKRGMYTCFRIPKGNGRYRYIHEPCAALKNVQKSILVTFLTQGPDTPKHVSAYVAERTTFDAAEQHVGQAVKISMDIKNFFPNTTRKMVRDELRHMGFCRDVSNMLSNLMVVPKATKTSVISVLPQGAPTSAAISNRIAMRLLDEPILQALSQTPGAVYTRYCDNLEVSFATQETREVIDAWIVRLREIVHATPYRLNKKKTSVQRKTSPTRPMTVLGISTKVKVNIPKHKYRNFRAIVHTVATKGLLFAAITYPPGVRRVEGREGDPAELLYATLVGELQYWAPTVPKVASLLQTLRNHNPGGTQ